MYQRLYSIFIVPILALSFFCISCGEEATQEVKDSYRLLRVKRQDFTLNREFAVKLESKRNISVRPLVSGRLTKICVQEGAHVKKGQALFVIDQAPYIAAVDAAKAQVATARATLATAQLNLVGKEKLYKQQMIGEFDLHRARYAKEEAYALLETAKAELDDRVKGLDAGADDYLPKPFQMAELLARLRSLTRRAGHYSPKQLQIGNVTLDLEQQELKAENSIRLAKKEARLMEYVMVNPEKAFSEEELLTHVWKDEDVDGQVVWVYISYLKSKLDAISAEYTIEGEPGGPYHLVPDSRG